MKKNAFKNIFHFPDKYCEPFKLGFFSQESHIMAVKIYNYVFIIKVNHEWFNK